MRSSFLLRTARGQSLDNASSLRGWLPMGLQKARGKTERGIALHSRAGAQWRKQWSWAMDREPKVERMGPLILHFNTK